jgi:hypothetical protein
MKGKFGFRYDPRSGIIDFEYEVSADSLQICLPQPVDAVVPLDREVATLAKELHMSDWAAPALRLVLLIGEIPAGELNDTLRPQLPNQLIAQFSGLRVLIHPTTNLSLRQWRKIGEMMGLLPGKTDVWKSPGIITSYTPKRKNTYQPLYWQTLLAYNDAIGERMEREHQQTEGLYQETAKVLRKRGLLKETAIILEKKYGWEYLPDTYTVRRYLDRAEKIWHISTHLGK